MNLRVGGGFAKFLCRIAEHLFVGWTVVEALAVSGDDGDHVRRIFSDQAEQLLLRHQVHSKAVNLMLLVDDVNNEEKHHPH